MRKLIQVGALDWIKDENGDIPDMNIPTESSSTESSSFEEFESLDMSENDGEISVALEDGKEERNIFSMTLFFLMSLLKIFWNQYRIFIYIGLLITTGAWTVIDYLPFISSSKAYNLEKFNDFCNPPTPQCNTGTPDFDSPVNRRGLEEVNLFFQLLIFGQFFLFIATVIMILILYKKSIRPLLFWVGIIMSIFVFLIGGASIFLV